MQNEHCNEKWAKKNFLLYQENLIARHQRESGAMFLIKRMKDPSTNSDYSDEMEDNSL